MDTTALTLVIAIAAIWFSLNCGLLVMYLWVKGDGAGARSPASRRSAVSAKGQAKVDVPVLVDENAGAWGVFVMFDDPTMASNERLSIVLASSGAVYDSSSRAFTLAGDSPRNPLLISNAYPPGTLPSFNQDNGDFPIKGVTVKMIKTSPNASPNKLQLVRLVKLAKELARIDGKVVDAEKQPITEAGFKSVIAGKAKV
ncbi:hypothetical protein LG301_15435 [Vreelandella venusta]|uniref:hypothetical protein n=1 Tax=Vreelandella venusta TaxID=44935 RepID=UPI00385167BC